MVRLSRISFLVSLLLPVAACGDDGGGNDEIGTDDLGTDNTGVGTDDATSDSSDTSSDTTTDTSTDTTSDTSSDSSDSSTDTTDSSDSSDSTDSSDTTTGGNGICGASEGAGGGSGLQQVVGDGYPQTPAVLYVPSDYAPAVPMPLMLALHGSGDTAGNFVNLWQNIAENEGFIVLVPESLSGGISWNPGTDGALISALLDEVLATFNIDECRLYMTGYSAGAHVTYMLGLYNADVFAGLGIQAGSLSYAEQAGVWPNEVPRKIAVDIQHGLNDPVVPIGHAQYAKAQLEGAGHVVTYSTHPGGHEVGPGDPQEMWNSLEGHTLDE